MTNNQSTIATLFQGALLAFMWMGSVRAGFETDVVVTTNTEFNTFGGRNECSDPSLRARIATYWTSVGITDGWDGCTDQPWSAAFISYMVREAGGGDRFAYSTAHRVYIRDAFNGGSGLYDSAVDVSTATPQVGDLACEGRAGIAGWTFANFAAWASGPDSSIPTHCDVVVAVGDDNSITTIGGNLGDTVLRQTVNKNNYAVLLVVTRTTESSDRLVDVGVLVDVSGSFSDDIADFKADLASIVLIVTAEYPNAHFGLATFQDFPLFGWGDTGDVPHARIRDIGPPNGAYTTSVNSLMAQGGGDFPESQLVSLYQAITGQGLIVPAALDGGYTIPAGLNFNFRANSARIILLWTDATFHQPGTPANYPGPTVAEVIAAAVGLNRRLDVDGDHQRTLQTATLPEEAVRIVGLVSVIDSTVVSEIAELSVGTGAVAGPDGVDCDGDGVVDVLPGDALICATTSGLISAVTTLVAEIVPMIPEVCECGFLGIVLFGIRIFCPFTGCGIIGTFLGLCACDS